MLALMGALAATAHSAAAVPVAVYGQLPVGASYGGYAALAGVTLDP